MFTHVNINAKMQHHMDFISEYGFDVNYTKGKDNVFIGDLSRRRHKISMITLIIDLWSFILEASPSATLY